MLAYENAESRAAALAVIPVQRLKREADALVARAAEKAAAEARSNAEPGSGRTADSSRQKSVSHADALLLRLLRWFKREFFTWCDAPACGTCGCTDAPTPLGAGVPTPDEAKHGASLAGYISVAFGQAPSLFPPFLQRAFACGLRYNFETRGTEF